MNTKLRKTIIATNIAALFLAPVAAFAAKEKDKWEYHEDKWDEVKSYANVMIAQDSGDEWGPWSEFVQPAAGGPAVGFLPAAGGELYTPLAGVVSPVDNLCGPGDWCGYAVFSNWTYQYGQYGEGYGDYYTHTRPHPARIALTLTPEDPSITPDGGEGYGTASWRAASLDGVAPQYSESGQMDAYFGYDWYYGSYSGGLRAFMAYRSESDGESNDWASAEGAPNGTYWGWGLTTSNPEATAGWFEREVENYIGDGGETAVFGYYVAGIATPQAYLDAQRIGDTSATYAGNSMDRHGYMTPVNMQVNFGSATWSGSWNGGADGAVNTNYDSDGNRYLTGNVGFNAGGTISGTNIQSTSVSAADAGVTGTVTGSFFGQEAGSIGGVNDIVKTYEGVGSASHVGVFIVDKVVAE